MRSVRSILAGVGIGAVALLQQVGHSGQEFELQVSHQNIPEAGRVATCLLRTGEDAYSFLPPAKWRIEANQGARKVNLIAPDTTLITIHPAQSAEIPTSGPKLEALRNQVIGRFPGAQVVEESVCYAEGGAGRAFDLEWKTDNGARFTTRFAIISVNGKAVEIVLTANAAAFQSHHAAFTGLLNSFQAAAIGRQ